MSLMFILLFWTAELLISTQCNELDECCYIYGSVPYNDSICVPEGRPVTFNYIIYNPHDNSTNLTVTWFRSATEDMSSYEAIPLISREFSILSTKVNSVTTLVPSVANCSDDLFRDQYSLLIYNFTKLKNGYYWCQLAINNTLVQRSRHALFYAGEQNSTNCSLIHPYFRSAVSNENQCVSSITAESPVTLSVATAKESLTWPTLLVTAPSVSTSIASTTQEQGSERPLLIYVSGSLGALILLLGGLVVGLSMLYPCKFWSIRSSKVHQRNVSNTGHQDTIAISADGAQQAATGEEDIYSVVSDNSIGDLGLHSSYQGTQSTNDLPYEVAVFHDQSLSDDAQNLQHTTDPKAAVQPCDESDQSKHNQQYRENQNTNDEQHVYDEVNYEAKEGKNKSIIPVTNEIACQKDGNNKELTTDSELFDDMTYSTHPVQTVDTSRATQQSKINADSMSQQHSEGSNVRRFHAKSPTNMNKDDYAESAALKMQKGQTRFNDEYIYDSADQLCKSQTATLTTISRDNNTTKFNAEADGTKHYHPIESTSPEIGSPRSLEMPIGHLSTPVQDINGQPAGGDPTLCNCQFDDPMYESTPHPGANLIIIATASSMKADASEPQEDESTMQGNPELLQKYSGDAENFTDAPQDSDPIDLAPVDNDLTIGNQDKVNRNLASIYDMFDDPTYGVCVTLDPTN